MFKDNNNNNNSNNNKNNNNKATNIKLPFLLVWLLFVVFCCLLWSTKVTMIHQANLAPKSKLKVINKWY